MNHWRHRHTRRPPLQAIEHALAQRLRNAAKSGDLPGVQAALAAGANLHADNDNALRWAAEHGHFAVVEHLLAAGAHVDAQDNYALRLASGRGSLDIVQALLAAGADVHALDGLALQAAAEGGHLDVVECLLAAGADVNANNGLALRWSAKYGHAAVVRLLRAKGASLAGLSGYFDRYPDRFDSYPEMVQVALFEAGDLTGISITDFAKKAVCPAALCVLLERQGQPGLANLISASQMLEPLTPDKRAEILSELLTQQRDRSDRAEVLHVLLPAKLNP